MHAGPDDRRDQELLPEVPASQPDLSTASQNLQHGPPTLHLFRVRVTEGTEMNSESSTSVLHLPRGPEFLSAKGKKTIWSCYMILVVSACGEHIMNIM